MIAVGGLTAAMKLPRRPFTSLSSMVMHLLGGESAAGILLILVAVAALLIANSPLAGA
jgi:Na+/H+ antiporter NhaA